MVGPVRGMIENLKETRGERGRNETEGNESYP